MRSHSLTYGPALAKQLNAVGPIAPTILDELARYLANALPPA
jgi:hypothetical protein